MGGVHYGPNQCWRLEWASSNKGVITSTIDNQSKIGLKPLAGRVVLDSVVINYISIYPNSVMVWNRD